MSVSLDDLMLIQVRYQLHAQRCINTFAYQCMAAPGIPTPEAVGTANFLDTFTAEFQADFLGAQSEEAINHVVRGQIYRNGVPDVRFGFREKDFGAQEGTIGVVSTPSGTSAVIKKIGALAGPSHRGRIFLAGVPVDGHAGSRTTDDYNDLLVALAIHMLVDISPVDGSIWSPVILSPDYAERDVISSVDVDRNLRYQRRREVGVGE